MLGSHTADKWPAPEASTKRTSLGQAAEVLDREAGRITARWVERLQETTYRGRADLRLEDIRDHAPVLVRGTAEALRRGQPGQFAAPWTGAAREHALLRMGQHVALGDLVREYQMLREEIWHALRQDLSAVPASDVYDVAEALDAALDTMASIATSTYGAELEHALAQAEIAHNRLGAVLQQMPSAVIIASAPSGSITLVNNQMEELWRRPFPLAGDIEQYAQYVGYHPNGRRYQPREWPLARSILTGEVVSGEEIDLPRPDGTRATVSVNSAPIHDREGHIIGAVSVLTDITKRKETEAARQQLLIQVQRRAAELDAILSSLPSGLVIYGPDGKIVHLNAMAERTLGYHEAQRRMPTTERVPRIYAETPEGKLVSVEELVVQPALRGKPVYGAILRLRKDPDRGIWLAANAAPIHTQDGQLQGAVLTLTDITPLRELEALRKAEAQREDLLLGISHHLRTRMAAIQGYAQFLLRAWEKADQVTGPERQSAEAIVDNVRRMNGMIQDLIDVTRLEAGQLLLSRRPVDLRAFLLDLLERQSETIARERIRVQAPERLPPVSADPSRLERILMALLTNALQYSTPGTEVTVRLTQSNGKVITSVQDRGPGIPPEVLPTLFERYEPMRIPSRRPERLGLSLYITRLLVEAHGGHIWAESQVGVGSTFSFSLPIGQA